MNEQNNPTTLIVVGILHDNNSNMNDIKASEFFVENIEQAIRQVVLLNNFEVPCYVAIGTNPDNLEIMYRNETLIELEHEQEVNAMNAAAEKIFGG